MRVSNMVGWKWRDGLEQEFLRASSMKEGH